MFIQILLQFLLGLLFLLFSVIAFTFPGLFILKVFRINILNLISKYVVSTVLGLTIFTLGGYVFAGFGIRDLMWLFPALGIVLLVKYRNEFFVKLEEGKLFGLVLFLGIVFQVAVNAASGFLYSDGIYFWSSHGHDGIWHISLMEEMKKNVFPFQNPELAGFRLQNYHFFVDLLMSEVSRLTRLSSLDLYFRFFPVLFSILLGMSGYVLIKEWANSKTAGIWGMVFIYFAGSFGYLLSLKKGEISGESTFWVSQTHSVLGNPPHAAAFILVSVFLYCFLKYLKDRKNGFFWICVLLGGAVIEFKVYAGLIILGGLFVVGIWELLWQRRLGLMLLFLATLFLAFVIYYPNSNNSQEFLIWEPWWYIRTMVVAPDRLNLLDWELRRQTYMAEENYKRVLQLELYAFLIFLFGNLGMRFVGFWAIFKKTRVSIFKNYFDLFFMVIVLGSFTIPHLFLQKGVAWNSIQFNQYFLLFFGFLAALGVDDLLKKVKNKLVVRALAILIVLLAIPTQIGLLKQFYGNEALSKIGNEEIRVLGMLKKVSNPEDIILTYPYGKYEKDRYKDPPIPIYAWYDTGYVSAMSSRKTLLSDEEQVTIMGYGVENLFKERERIFQSKDVMEVNNYLKEKGIDYTYLIYDQKFGVDESKLNLELIARDGHARLFKVKKDG